MITPKQYGQIATWIAAGVCEYECGSIWCVLSELPPYRQIAGGEFSHYRKRPEPEMPDDVWIHSGSVGLSCPIAHTNKEHCENCAIYYRGAPVRYIRADKIIDGSKLQHRVTDGKKTWWVKCRGCEYQFVP